LRLLRLSFDRALDLRNNTCNNNTRFSKKESRIITINLLTFWPHSNAEAFFEPTLLTLASHVHINLAVVAVLALVDCIFGDAAPEEACPTQTHKVKTIAIIF